MVSINLGSIANIGGKNSVGGISSHLDTKALIESQIATKKIPITEKEEAVALNKNKIAAYKEMKTLIGDLKDQAKNLHNPPNPLEKEDDVFNLRIAEGVTNELVDYDKFIKIEANPCSSLTNYTFNISQLAIAKSEQIGATNTFPLDVTAIATQTGFATRDVSVTTVGGLANTFSVGTFKINTIEVALELGDSLDTIRDKINYLQSQTNVRADVMQVSASDFRLTLTSVNTGGINAYVIDDTADNVLASLNKVNLSVAQDAMFTINGTAYTRPTNQVDDAIDNVQITLLNKNTNSTIGDPNYKNISVNLTQDPGNIKLGILKFILSYNKFMQFVAKQQERNEDDNKLVETAFLGKDQLFIRSAGEIRESLRGRVVGIADGQLNTLESIGITFATIPADAAQGNIEAKNSMIYNETILEKALDGDLEQLRKVFEFDFVAPNNKIIAGKRTAMLNINSFTLNINTAFLSAPYLTTEQVAVSYLDDLGVPQTEYADFTLPATSSPGNLSGTIVGREDTVLFGLSMIYLGSAAPGLDSINISLTQGLADRAFAAIHPYTTYNGTIDIEIQNIIDKNERSKNDLERMNHTIDRFRDRQLNLYGRLEQQALAANTSLNYMDAMTNIQNNTKR